MIPKLIKGYTKRFGGKACILYHSMFVILHTNCLPACNFRVVKPKKFRFNVNCKICYLYGTSTLCNICTWSFSKFLLRIIGVSLRKKIKSSNNKYLFLKHIMDLLCLCLTFRKRVPVKKNGSLKVRIIIGIIFFIISYIIFFNV